MRHRKDGATKDSSFSGSPTVGSRGEGDALMAYPDQPDSPDPTTATGIIAGFVEGIALAFIDKIFAVIFTQLAAIQQSLNHDTTLFDIGAIFTSWGVAYFLLAYVVPIVAAYAWARKTGVAVYCVGWIGTTVFLNGRFTLGIVLLVIASMLVVIVDLVKNSGANLEEHRGPPIR